MVDIRLTINTQPLDEAVQYFDNIQLELERIGDRVQREIEPTLLAELAYYPDLPSRPFVWSKNPTRNRKAQRYYFAAVNRGEIATSGGRYVRTGRYGRSWFMEQTVERGVFILRIGSTYPAAKWIGGTLNQRSIGEAIAWQIPGHNTTGWPQQVRTVNFFVDAAQELFINGVLTSLETLAIIGKTTRRSRR